MTTPSNVHVSTHPCLQAKISQFRSKSTDSRDTNRLVHEITLLLGAEALAEALTAKSGETDQSHLNHAYPRSTITERLSLVPILRSGLGMVDGILTLLPHPCPVHHLGLFREPTTGDPVEYYNNLPNHETPPGGAQQQQHVAIIVDPIIATGGTAAAAIQTLRDWGVDRVVFLCLIGSEQGLRRAAEEWPGKTQIWTAAVDGELDGKRYLVPGCGDVGDRLFLTKGR